ncbi:MAG: HsdR family type I site-specific deoxyribonuclease, partial [Candidatus Cloacimonetes bacterium]|nr:HsdR family type I site-specific deoxyribonuclease [Candidatus Cloacimonadota bacterium]
YSTPLNIVTNNIIVTRRKAKKICILSYFYCSYKFFLVIISGNAGLMVLRPYQYYAVEKIVNRVENKVQKNGYIWHTTGSGKTLTSFKASQILTMDNDVDKVIFVVDRKDLDYHTMTEFNSYSKGSVDGTENTKVLIKQVTDNKTKLIITTIQKLNSAISKRYYQTKMEVSRDKRIIFIFDECHRSQFGDTHKRISKFFTNKTFFGFTGTPIFNDNKINFSTTKDLFDECLHRYVIKDAIDDDNVLGFSVEYYSTFSSRKLLNQDGSDLDVDDIKVKDINTKEVFDSDKRLKKIVNFIVKNHNTKTYSKDFNAIFAISSIPNLLKYYEIFKSIDHDLKIAAIFSYQENQSMTDIDGNYEYEELDQVAEPVIEYKPDYSKQYTHSRENLDVIVGDYNKMYNTNFDLNNANGFNAYNVDISKKVKERKIDILLVVDMFLTGFDSKYLNTLYIDKNLRYHGLIQAYSRTNRIFGERKRYGNIVAFRNLKRRTDEAIKLFSNVEALETVLMKPYQEYVNEFNKNVIELLIITPSIKPVDELEGEEQKAAFIKAFRILLRIMNILTTFTEFTFADLSMTKQQFEDYRSKYLDLFDLIRNARVEKESIMDDLDFEVELIWRDNINVAYIMKLLKDLDTESPGYPADVEFILKTMAGSEQLRDKRELVENFINKNLPELPKDADFEESFDEYLDRERSKEIDYLAETENLDKERLYNLIEDYEFSNKIFGDRITETFISIYRFIDRRKKMKNIKQKIIEIVNKYRW